MSNTTLRYLIAAVIAMLLIFQIGAFTSDVYGIAWGVFSAVVVTLIMIVSARLSRQAGKSSFWLIIPIVLLAITSIVFMSWKAVSAEVSWFDRIVSVTPFIIGFAAPMILLLIVYYELRSRAKKD